MNSNKSNWLSIVLASCPLKILRVDWNDPQLTISGQGWGFNTLGPWRLRDSEKMLSGSGDPEFEATIKALIGVEILSCKIANPDFPVDPCFILSNDQMLEFFSDTTYEPWTMGLPKPPSLVAEPGDSRWQN